jgi:hypothetical protein
VKKHNRSTRSAVIVALAAMAVVGLALSPAVATAAGKKATKLVGTFKVTEGAFEGTTPTGSYFRMVQPGGTVDAGPYVPNGDSTASDTTYTLLTAGTQGGLRAGKYQPQPEPPFDSTGNGVADAIVAPTKFFGVNFAVATNKKDPQTGDTTTVPTISVKGKKLTGNLSAYGVAYGNQHFNQGVPKPDGSKPGETSGPTGTYSSKTGEYSLDWSSAIVGGPFDGFTGIWHLEGTFTKAR